MERPSRPRLLVGAAVVVLLVLAVAVVLNAGVLFAPSPGASVSVVNHTTTDDVELLNVTVEALDNADSVRLVDPRGDVVDQTTSVGDTIYAYPARTGTYEIVAVKGDRTAVVRTVQHDCTGFCPDVVVDPTNETGAVETNLSLAAWHARPGDTIYVRNGTYYETYVGVGSRGELLNGLTIEGQSRTGVVIEGNVTANETDLVYVDGAENVTIRTLTLNTDGDNGITTYGKHTRISNVSFVNIHQNAIDAMAETTISNVTFERTGGMSIYVGPGGSNTTVRDARISGGTTGAFTDQNARQIAFTRVAFTNTTRYGLYVQSHADTVSLTDATFTGNAAGAIFNDDEAHVLDATGSYWGTKNVTATCEPEDTRLKPQPERVNASDPRCTSP